MTALKVEFVSRVAPAYKLKGDRIVARRGPTLEVRPLDNGTLYAQFAALSDTPKEFADFMASFGPLTNDPEGERLDVLVAMRKWMAGVVKLLTDDPDNLVRMPGWRSPERIRGMLRRAKLPGATSFAPNLLSAAATMQAIVGPGAPDGRPTLHMQPDTLWDAMKLQLYIAVSSGGRLKACDWCGTWFESGGSGKRSHAKFCSDACRLNAHRQKNGVSK